MSEQRIIPDFDELYANPAAFELTAPVNSIGQFVLHIQKAQDKAGLATLKLTIDTSKDSSRTSVTVEHRNRGTGLNFSVLPLDTESDTYPTGIALSVPAKKLIISREIDLDAAVATHKGHPKLFGAATEPGAWQVEAQPFFGDPKPIILPPIHGVLNVISDNALKKQKKLLGIT